MKKNVSRMPNSLLYMQRDLEKDNGHFLVLVQRRSGGQGDGVTKAYQLTGGGGLAKVPNLRVCKHPFLGSGTRRGEG